MHAAIDEPGARFWTGFAARLGRVALAGMFVGAAGFLSASLGLVDLDVLKHILAGTPLGWTAEGLWERPAVRWGARLWLAGLGVVGVFTPAWLGAREIALAGGWYLFTLRRRAALDRGRSTPRQVWGVAIVLEGEGDGIRPETVLRYLATFGASEVPSDPERDRLGALRLRMAQAADVARDALSAGGQATSFAVVPWAGRSWLAQDLIVLADRAAKQCAELRQRAPPLA